MLRENLNAARDPVPTEAALAARAASAVAAAVETGAAILVAQPWRIARIVRGADDMTADELGAEVARRRRAGPPADMNRAIAFAQLAFAVRAPGFDTRWAAWRSRRDQTTVEAERVIICLVERSA